LRTPRLICGGARALGLAALCLPAVADEPSGAQDRLLEALRSLRDPAGPPVAELALRLEPSAAEGLELLLDVLLDDAVPGEDGGRAKRMGEPQRELVLALLAELPPSTVLGELDRQLAATEDPRARLGALYALGAVGSATEMADFFQHAATAAEALPLRRVEPALEDALPGLLARSESSRDWLVVRWRSLDEELLPSVVRAVGAARHPDGLELMLDMIETRPDLEIDAMAQVAHLVPATSVVVDMRLRDQLRACLMREEPGVQRAALRALGELEDAESVPRWIELLERADRGVQGDALWALRRLSGLELTADPADWRRWHAAERRWFAEELGGAIAALEGSDAAAAAVALRELSRHRLERAVVARAVATGLTHPAAGVRRLSCELLEQLARPEVRPDLEGAAEDLEPTVREAARRALARLRDR
jgi:HEAT repeat protein